MIFSAEPVEKSGEIRYHKEKKSPERGGSAMDELEKTNVVILTDEDGVEKEFEHIDTIEDNGEVYMAFIPTELDLEEEAEVVILKVVEEDGLECLASVDDFDESERVFQIFMERADSLYDFDEPEEEE